MLSAMLPGFFVAIDVVAIGALCADTFVTAAELGIVAPGVLLITATEPVSGRHTSFQVKITLITFKLAH